MEEGQLIHRARQGDQTAWLTLVEQHQQALFRLAYLILGDPDDAKDIAQEAFLRAYRNLARFKDQHPLRPWLLRITVNLARNRQRALRRYWAALTRLRRSQESQPRQTPEAINVRKGEAEMLWQAVRQLRKIDQDVIYLRFFLALSVDETAQALKVAPGTVKSRQHRALERLKAIICQEYPTLMET